VKPQALIPFDFWVSLVGERARPYHGLSWVYQFEIRAGTY